MWFRVIYIIYYPRNMRFDAILPCMTTACVVTVALSSEGTMTMRGRMSKETGAPDVRKNYRNVKTISVV